MNVYLFILALHMVDDPEFGFLKLVYKLIVYNYSDTEEGDMKSIWAVSTLTRHCKHDL